MSMLCLLVVTAYQISLIYLIGTSECCNCLHLPKFALLTLSKTPRTSFSSIGAASSFCRAALYASLRGAFPKSQWNLGAISNASVGRHQGLAVDGLDDSGCGWSYAVENINHCTIALEMTRHLQEVLSLPRH